MTLPRSPAPPAPEFRHPQTQACWKALDCRFQQVADVFEECLYEALASLSRPGVEAYVEAARTLGKLGRGADPVLAFLEGWPQVAEAVGEASLPALMALVAAIQKSPNGPALVPLLQTLAPVARRLRAAQPMARYLAIAADLMARTTGSVALRSSGPKWWESASYRWALAWETDGCSTTVMGSGASSDLFI